MSRIEFKKIEKILMLSEKPGRYIGGELNSIKKENAFIRMALSYPDIYEIGMANNGIKILYEIANSIPEVACERVFCPAPDFEKSLINSEIPLYTLETYTPIAELDIIGFNIAHEMLYTGILHILDLGRIPLKSKERNETHPIVIAGGESVLNPAPLHEFIDAFFIGEGEEGLKEILVSLLECKRKKHSRKQMIEALSEIESVFVPLLYEIKNDESSFKYYSGKKIKRRVFHSTSLNDPLKPIVPNLKTSYERAVIEVTRGCFNLCKFCHASYNSLPYREFSPEMLAEKSTEIIRNTGYTEIALSSLSIGDYRALPKLLNILLPEFNKNGISISLPSLKIDRKTIPVIEAISDVRKPSLTFAVESACEETRKMIHKRLLMKDLFEIFEIAVSKGWKTIKLYFMLGLPGFKEIDESEMIIDFLKKILVAGRSKLEINVTLSPFVPKPHTPFQSEEMASRDYFNSTIERIKKGVPRKIKIKNHCVEQSIVEGILSRGDASLSETLLQAYKSGCRLDSWSEHFDISLWEKALEETVPDFEKYMKKMEGGNLPWQVISSASDPLMKNKNKKILDDIELSYTGPQYKEALDIDHIKSSLDDFKKKFESKFFVRFDFGKNGISKYTSHLDFVEVIRRSMRMSGIPLSYTQGFNKREKLSFGYPVQLGLESLSELVDAECYEQFDLNESLRNFNQTLPEGIRLNTISINDNKESIMKKTNYISYDVFCNDSNMIKKIIKSMESKINLRKKGKERKEGDLISYNEAVFSGLFDKNCFSFVLSVGKNNSIRIDTLLENLSGSEFNHSEFNVKKTGQFTSINGELVRL